MSGGLLRILTSGRSGCGAWRWLTGWTGSRFALTGSTNRRRGDVSGVPAGVAGTARRLDRRRARVVSVFIWAACVAVVLLVMLGFRGMVVLIDLVGVPPSVAWQWFVYGAASAFLLWATRDLWPTRDAFRSLLIQPLKRALRVVVRVSLMRIIRVGVGAVLLGAVTGAFLGWASRPEPPTFPDSRELRMLRLAGRDDVIRAYEQRVASAYDEHYAEVVRPLVIRGAVMGAGAGGVVGVAVLLLAGQLRTSGSAAAANPSGHHRSGTAAGAEANCDSVT